MRLLSGAEVSPTLRARAQEVFEDAFPPALRSPFDSLFADEVLCCTDGDDLAGLVVLRRLAGTGTVFVRYFVAARRGEGLGSRMWHALREHLGEDLVVALDVEHPDEPGLDTDEAVVRARRVVFYERLGLSVLPVQEYAPPHDGEAHPMLLLASPAPTGAAGLVSLVEAVHLHRYGLAPEHPVVRRVVAASGLARRPGPGSS